jgi:uncharacterized iron-regulated protein
MTGSKRRSLAAAVAGMLLGQWSPLVPAAACVNPARWVVPTAAGPQQQDSVQLLKQFAARPVVLLGEEHDNAEHHRWQLHTIAALHALQPNLVLGFEMFPRRVQPALDQWVAGELSEAQFLARSEWNRVWGFDARLYMPIFEFARMHRVPMVALNVERGLVAEVGKRGWSAVPEAEREGVSDPAAATADYLAMLYASYVQHQAEDDPLRTRAEPDYADAGFRRFVDSMQVWDRAMAQAIVRARGTATPPLGIGIPLVVGLMGRGHLDHGFGVPHQLRDLGVSQPAVLLPWNVQEDCATFTVGLADAVFGIQAAPGATRERPRLGVMLDAKDGGVVVRDVLADSIAAAAGLQAGDAIVTIAGVPVQAAGDVIEAVRQQAPGTWLPMTVTRGSESLELVARFPPRR